MHSLPASNRDAWVEAVIAALPSTVADDHELLREVAVRMYGEIGREVRAEDAAKAIAHEMRSRAAYAKRPVN